MAGDKPGKSRNFQPPSRVVIVDSRSDDDDDVGVVERE